MQTYPAMTRTNVDPDAFHSIQLACKRVKDENESIQISTFDDDANPEIPHDPENKKEIEHMTPENKQLILETDNAVLIDCTVQWMNMLNNDLQQRILERVTTAKKEIEDEQDVEKEEEIKKEPEVLPAKVSMSTQTEPIEEVSQPGSSRQREEPASDESSRQREESKEEKNINDDDTAPPEKETPTQVWYGQDISGNEPDSVLRKLSDCFSDGYHKIWAGFYNYGFPALPSNRHMLWHLKYRKTTEMHLHSWYDISEEILMQEYINRHKDEIVIDLLEEIRAKTPYGCSDPRLHIRARQDVDKFTKTATGRHQEDFESLHALIEDYIKDHDVIPYAIILQLLACRYLGAGMLDEEKVDRDYTYRSTRSLSCMFWNLGNWNRKYHSKCPLPEHLEKFRPHIRFDLDADHNPIGNRPLYNNFFVAAVRNLAAHLFMNCEAGSLFENRKRLEESGWTTCFNDFTDLMCAARIGKDGYVKQIAGYSTSDDDVKPRFVSWAIFEVSWGKTKNRTTGEIEDLTRARVNMTRVCIYHVNQHHIGRAAAMCGEVIATMCWECTRYEVDIITGDGNKAAYYTTPKNPGVPTYECSLLQFWIERMINTATQARIKHFGKSPKIRSKHFISCSYTDLVHLQHHLRKITTDTYNYRRTCEEDTRLW